MAPKKTSRPSSKPPKDSTSTTTADDNILTPMENSSNKSEAEVPKVRIPRRLASKTSRKPKISAAPLVFTMASESDPDNAADDSSEVDESPEVSDSDTDDEAEETKKKSLARKKTKSKKTKSAPKSRKGHSSTKKSKKKVKEKKKSAAASPESDSDSSDTSESDEDGSDVDKASAQSIPSDPSVQSKILALQSDVLHLYQQVNFQLQQQPQYVGAAPGQYGYYPYPGIQNPVGIPNPHAGIGLQAPPPVQVPPSASSLALLNMPTMNDTLRIKQARPGVPPPARHGFPNHRGVPAELLLRGEAEPAKKSKSHAHAEFKRVDQVWDNKIHNFRLQDTAEASQNSKYDKYVFHVRRTFDWEGKYRATFVDIKSKLLRECLEDVIGNVKGVSLVDETPKLDPNLLFLYLDDLRTHLVDLKDLVPAGESRKEIKKNRVRLETKIHHLKLLVKYIDTDYAEIKEALYPMLESGIITFELLWALWKPKTLAYTSTYGCTAEPRIFKVDMAQVHSSVLTGQFHYIEGKYFEFDGKKFGYGAISEEIPEFQGARKITSLSCYPLKYHKNEERLRAELVERGKKFVSLCGVHYKSYSGMAFMKRKKNQVIKFNVSQSRVMIDPSIFRRINPNYHVSPVKPKDHDIISDDGLSDASEDEQSRSSGSDASCKKKPKFATKVFLDKNGNVCTVKVRKELLQQESQQKTLDSLPPKDSKSEVPVIAKSDDAPGQGNEQSPEEKTVETTEETPSDETDDKEEEDAPEDFSEEEYLLASPVVLGFAFSEKQWLEFTVSGIKDIKWNVKAWDSLVLEEGTKDLVKALVVSRKYHAANTIDDVIQGKGKGLVTVLHGPPGTGKTLTAEGISELLKCPLYMASAGELGTDSRYLEAELQKILDICHTWGAILLLDEADVFLEKRNMHDIHRNALVSIFLRQLEYFQGILFLTTNRVESFDEAFQSRIHIALRYDNLDVKAKRTIFKMFLDRVKELGKLEVKALTDEDLNRLSKHDLNGREIKNVVGSAQDLAVHKKEALGMRHILQVLEVHAKFGRDLKGGTGYEDAMRSYF